MKMLRPLVLSLALAIPLGGAVACGGDDSNIDYPPFPPPTGTPDGSPPPPTPDGMPAGPATPILNEVVIDDPSSVPEDGNFVEIFGDPSTDYSNYTIVGIEGDDISTQGEIRWLDEVGTTDADGRYATTLGDVDYTRDVLTFLLVEDFTGELDDDLDTDDDGTLDSEPWTSVADALGVEDGADNGSFTYVEINGTTYGPVVTATGTDGGFALIPDGTADAEAGDWVRIPIDGVADDDTEADATPGAENTLGPSS